MSEHTAEIDAPKCVRCRVEEGRDEPATMKAFHPRASNGIQVCEQHGADQLANGWEVRMSEHLTAEKGAPTIEPVDWAMDMGSDGRYPFTEDENANITGFGHQDKSEFAAAVNRYDTKMNGESFPEGERWTARDITHKWAVLGEVQGEPRLFPAIDGVKVTPDTPGAVAITTLWGLR